jgi:hypothetical protein
MDTYVPSRWSRCLAPALLLACSLCLFPPAAVPAPPAAASSNTWYFAEGYTGPGFEEYLTLQNPNPGTARVEVAYYGSGGQLPTVIHHVPGESRYTIYVNADAGPGLELSVRLDSDLPIVVERPMYFLYQGRVNGGHVGRGATGPSDTWYFAEGYTGPGFDEYLTLENPNPYDCYVEIEYMIRGGEGLVRPHVVPASSRYTIKVNDDAGERLEVSCRLRSYREDRTTPAGIIAERPIYFLYGGTIDGGSVSLGSTALGASWYFAEGYTGDYFEEYLTIMNPQEGQALVRITYYTDAGAPFTRADLPVPAHGRETVLVNADVGPGRNVSARVESDRPILAERPMYFSYLCGDLQALGGDVAMGGSPALEWRAAEGYTGPVFYEYLTALNPNAEPVTLGVTYILKGEPAIYREYPVPASSRYTILVNGEIGPGRECSLEVVSAGAGLLPVVLERPMYFLYQGFYNGGHVSTGYNE